MKTSISINIIINRYFIKRTNILFSFVKKSIENISILFYLLNLYNLDKRGKIMTGLEKVKKIINLFNSSFEFKPELNESGEIENLKIISLKNDGSEFITEFFDTFSEIVSSISKDYTVIFNEDKGLAIAKQITKYQIEE